MHDIKSLNLTHRLIFGVSRSFIITEDVIVDVLREEDVDVDPRLGVLANTFHSFAQAIAQQFLSDAHTHDTDFMNGGEVKRNVSQRRNK